VAQADPAPEPPSGELEPGQGVDRDDVRVDEGANIADDLTGVTALQHHADALAQRRDVRASDPTANDHDGRARLGRRSLLSGQPQILVRCHLFTTDRSARRNSSRLVVPRRQAS